MRPIRVTVLLALAACALVAACTREAPWRTDDISGLVPDLAFTMTDDSGRAVTERDYRGHVVLLYLGYTHCPDVCPTTLAHLAQALGATRDHGAGARVLFVTVDPVRDTLAHLHEYAHAFGPQFVGLRGDDASLEALARRYRLTYSLGKPDAKGDYEVTHSSAVFVFDRDGRARLLITPQRDVAAVSADLDRLAAGG
jgi:protein SCO1/2